MKFIFLANKLPQRKEKKERKKEKQKKEKKGKKNARIELSSQGL